MSTTTVRWRSKHTGNINETPIKSPAFAVHFSRALESWGHPVLAVGLHEAPSDAELLALARQSIGQDTPADVVERELLGTPFVQKALAGIKRATNEAIAAQLPDPIPVSFVDDLATFTDPVVIDDHAVSQQLRDADIRRTELEALGIVALRKVASGLPKERKISGAWDLKKPALIDAILAAEVEA